MRVLGGGLLEPPFPAPSRPGHAGLHQAESGRGPGFEPGTVMRRQQQGPGFGWNDPQGQGMDTTVDS